MAKQIYNEQVCRSWSGLCTEVVKICQALGLPYITKETVNKTQYDSMVKKAVRKNHEEELSDEVA